MKIPDFPLPEQRGKHRVRVRELAEARPPHDPETRPQSLLSHSVGPGVLGQLLPEVEAASRPAFRPAIGTGRVPSSLCIEHDPDHAARRLEHQIDVHIHGPRGRAAVAGFELDVAEHAAALHGQVVTGAVDLGPQHLEVAHPATPERTEQLAHKQVLDDLLAQRGMQEQVGSVQHNLS